MRGLGKRQISILLAFNEGVNLIKLHNCTRPQVNIRTDNGLSTRVFDIKCILFGSIPIQRCLNK